MKTMTAVVISFALTLTIADGQAQPRKMNVGDTLPDVNMNVTIDGRDTCIELSQIRSSYVILDFWSHSCVSCFKAFPIIDSLQQEFAGRIQFILVNKESQDSTSHFFKTRKGIRRPNVPSVSGDTLLSAFVTADGYPFSIWIDSNRVIQYVTYSYNFTREHFRRMLDGEHLKLKKSNQKLFSGNLFEFASNQSRTPVVDYYCYINRCTDGFDPGNNLKMRINDSTIRISATCHTIIDLYIKAYRENGKYRFSHPRSIMLDVTDRNRYIRPVANTDIDLWRALNTYNFDLILPKTRADDAFAIMRQQLFFYFGLKVSVSRKVVEGQQIDILTIKE